MKSTTLEPEIFYLQFLIYPSNALLEHFQDADFLLLLINTAHPQ